MARSKKDEAIIADDEQPVQPIEALATQDVVDAVASGTVGEVRYGGNGRWAPKPGEMYGYDWAGRIRKPTARPKR